jgi:hypothetical protein
MNNTKLAQEQHYQIYSLFKTEHSQTQTTIGYCRSIETTDGRLKQLLTIQVLHLAFNSRWYFWWLLFNLHSLS